MIHRRMSITKLARVVIQEVTLENLGISGLFDQPVGYGRFSWEAGRSRVRAK